MDQKIETLTEKERAWISTQLEGAAKLVEIMEPEAAGQPLTLSALDAAFGAWLALDTQDSEVVNAVINQVGIAFGQVLVDRLGLSWVIATDKQGSDLAVYGLPGKGDVLVYPANLVAKRWERRETDFLQTCFEQTESQLQKLAAAMPPSSSPQTKSTFLKRLFGT